jgi:PAS domain S-box-containing protein
MALLTNLEQIALIFQDSPIGIALVDGDLTILRSNPALSQKLGVSQTDLDNRTLLDFCHTWDRPKIRQAFQTCERRPGDRMRIEVRFFHPVQQFLWVLMTIKRIEPEDGVLPQDGYVVLIQDIHRRKEMEQELNELHRRLIGSLEEGSKKLAQDLHDGPMQDLHSITYQITAISEDLDPELRPQIESILKTVQRVNQELRAIAYNLRPPVLSKFGLAKSIRSYADEFSGQHPDLKLQLDLVPDRNMISEEISLALFRIFQQALMNIVRHAAATEVHITLALDGDAVSLEISDNGRGFLVPKNWIALVRAGHYGLAGTAERIKALGGQFQVLSEPGKGTTIKVSIPDFMEKP